MAVIVGTISVWIGAVLGSIIALYLGRYVVRKPIESKIKKYKIFDAIDKVITKQVSNDNARDSASTFY